MTWHPCVDADASLGMWWTPASCTSAMAVCTSQAVERTAQSPPDTDLLADFSDRWLSPAPRSHLGKNVRAGQELKARRFPTQSSHASHVTLHVLPLTLATRNPVCQAYVLHQRASADAWLAWRGQALLLLPAMGHAVVAASHKHVRLLGVADGGRGFGDVWEVRDLGDMVQQAACLRVVGVAVGVAVLFLYVPPKFPALPGLQDFRLHLREELRVTQSKGGCLAWCVNEWTHFFIDKAVQDGHQETLWRPPGIIV